MVWLIVGLGNPGDTYTNTRHNIGFACVDYFAAEHDVRFQGKRSKAHIAEAHVQGQRVVLAKPVTYMNLSGHAVSGLCAWYKIDVPHHLLVVYDDMDLPFGTIRLRQSGGPGTHNGMKSIVGQLSNRQFLRLRVGIGAPPPRWDVSAYVLGKFTQDETSALPHLYEQVSNALAVTLHDGFTTAMNRFNANATKTNRNDKTTTNNEVSP